ncbi:hypothetical protein [Kribbella sp. NPDC023855]|uniref:hypothetical protein n=1 Tax=Kribbella sp. NPDC023855 TaxID=3154698 RepID=UPI0033FA122B
MAALENLRERWLVVGSDLLVRVTQGICDGSLLNADSGRADTRARIEEWSDVLSLYAPVDETDSVRVSA